jgi:hypothetical protein
MRDGFYTFPARGTPDVWMYTCFLVHGSNAVGGPDMRNFAVEAHDWVGDVMEDSMRWPGLPIPFPLADLLAQERQAHHDIHDKT